MRLILFALLIVAGMCVAGERPKVIKVGLHYSAPWAYADAQGRLQGIDYDIVRHVFRRAGVEFEIELFAYQRLIQKFRNKELDYVSPMAFEIHGAHRTAPYLAIQDVVVTNAATEMVLENISDLSGKAVVAYQKASEVLGPAFSRVMKNGAYMEMADRERQLDLLINHKVDAVVGDRRVLEYFSRKNYGPDRINVHALFPQADYPGAFWDATLTPVFNREIEKMRASGLLQALYSQPRR